MKTDIECHACGAKVVKYSHNFNSGLAIALTKLKKIGGKSALKDLDLTVNQFNNFQKIQYWGLVEKYHEAGIWKITKDGDKFLAGGEISKKVLTFRGKRIAFGDEKTTIDKLRKEYLKKADYVKERKGI